MRVSALLLLASLGATACAAPGTDAPARPAVTARGDTTTAPELRAAFALLDRTLTPAQRDTLRATPPDALSQYHLSLGMYLRAQLGLWRGGPIVAAFRARGLTHPDDISAVLLGAYWLRLQGRPIALDSLITAVPPAPTGFTELRADSI
jgi:hypothetical protein